MLTGLLQKQTSERRSKNGTDRVLPMHLHPKLQTPGCNGPHATQLSQSRHICERLLSGTLPTDNFLRTLI
jgi:hypothetical protein